MQTRIAVRVKPRSKQQGIVFDRDGTMIISVSAPACENKANEAVIKILAEHFGIAKSNIQLVKGQKGKMKIFAIFKPR